MMEKPQSLPDSELSSSTAYSSGGLNHPHFVDDLSCSSDASSNSTSAELQATVHRSAIKNEGDRSADPFAFDLAQVYSSPDFLGRSCITKFINYLKSLEKKKYSKFCAENPQLMANIEIFIGSNERANDTSAQKPMLASELDIWSSFQEHGKHLFHHREGARATDHRIWTDGFDAAIFAKSARLRQDDQATPILVKYRLSGTEQKYCHFYHTATVYRRSRAAFHQLTDIVDAVIASPAAPPELSRIARQFFAGQPLDTQFELNNINATSSGDFDRQGYKIEYEPLSPWVKFLHEVHHAAQMESAAEGRDIVMFKNTSHKAFGIFIQDVILSNEMKMTMGRKVLGNSVKIFHSEAQLKAEEILSKNKSLSKNDVDSIARVRAVDDQDKFRVFFDTEDEDQKMIKPVEGVEAIAEAAAEQLLAEQAAELSKIQSEKESKSVKRKGKAKNYTAKPVSQEESLSQAKSGEKAEPSEEVSSSKRAASPEQVVSSKEAASPKQAAAMDKVEESTEIKVDPNIGRKLSKNAGTKKSEILISNVPAGLSSSSSASNTKNEGKSKVTVTDKSTASSGPVITLADFEDAPPGTLYASYDSQGWQTVKKTMKPKPTSIATVRVSSGGVPGAIYEAQRGINRSAGPVQGNIRQPASMNRSARPVAQSDDFTMVTRNSKSLVKNNLTPATAKSTTAKETSTKAVVQAAVIGEPEVYEEEFPAMPAKNSKPSSTKQSLKVTTSTPQKMPKTSAVAKGKTTTPVFKKTEVDEQSTVEASSDSILAAKTVKSDMSEGEPAAKGSAPQIPAPTKMTKKRSTKSKKKEQADPFISTLKLSSALSSGANYSTNKKVKSEDVESEDAFISQPVMEAIQVPSATLVAPDVIESIEVLSNLHEDESQFGESYSDGQSTEGPSHLEENYPVTPLCAAPIHYIHVEQVTGTPVDTEMEVLLKQVDDPLSWVTGPLTGPADFQGRPRRQSLPSDSYRGSGIFGDDSPSFNRRARGLSLRSHVSEQVDDESERSPSPVPEEIPDAPTDQSSSNSTSKKTIVVTINPDNTFSVALPPIDTSSRAQTSATSSDQVLSSTTTLPSSMTVSGSTQIMPYPAEYFQPNGFSYVSTPLAGVPGMMNYQVHISTSGAMGQGLGDTPHSTNFAQEDISCKYCHDKIVPTVAKPVVFCSGCGPGSPAIYCTVACLLVHAYDHHSSCWNTSGKSRAAMPQILPPETPYIYETNPVIPESMHRGTPEKFRQRTFMLYARYGHMPNLAEAWLRKNKDWPKSTAKQPLSTTEQKESRETLIDWEKQKYTGVYHIFSSGVFEDHKRCYSKADIIYTIYFDQSDGRRGLFSRVLHALMIHEEITQKPLATFAWRMIRGVLMDPVAFKYWGVWEKVELVVGEFDRQFELEFGYNGRSVRQPPFIFDQEAYAIMPYLRALERAHPVLGYWNRDEVCFF